MAKKRPDPEAKFQKGDQVKECKHIALTVNPNRPFQKRQERGVGTVIDVVVKKNRAGQRHFYYSVLWSGTSTESLHSQMRLKHAEETEAS